MKVGIIGSGGREHAICHCLKKSNKINEIFVFQEMRELLILHKMLILILKILKI